MKRITADITLEDCAEKLPFYTGIFGGEMRTVKTTPSGEVMRAELRVSRDCALYFHDVFHYDKPVYGSVVVVLETESENELRCLFKALGEGGGVHFEITQTEWNSLHGVVEDKHGVVWSLNYMLA